MRTRPYRLPLESILLNKAVFFDLILLVSLLIGSSIALGQDTRALSVRAEPYNAQCESQDDACFAWKQFRQEHPFPFQDIQGKVLSDGTVAIIISEPAPVLSKKSLDSLVRSAFGLDLKSINRRRWKMGVDGWLEDLVLKVDTGNRTGNPLNSPVMKDRIAFLNLALFGTTFGSGINMQDPARAVTEKGPPNLRVAPSDVKQWMADTRLLWSRLDEVNSQPASWKSIATNKIAGAFVSSDKSLVLLSVPAVLIQGAIANPNAMDPLRVAFRCFAVSSDTVVGVLQDSSGQIGILGRWRTEPLSSVPPLRFETFKQIASQSADELSQSYERGSIFSGKLASGPYAYKDWAPIYLSDPLVDTEFGALLNTTDQLLKSWSQSGQIEYLYFNYVRPSEFPFGTSSLSDVVKYLNGSSEVLFNWNTSGAGTLVSEATGKVLTIRDTGALPVTYGSETKESSDVKTGHLLEQEEKAYSYFASRRDANLSRVVSYTMLYQFCRALANDRPRSISLVRVAARDDVAARARRAAADVRVAATLKLLTSVRADQVRVSLQERAELQKTLKAVHDRYPTFTDSQLASLISDRFSSESKKLEADQSAQVTALSRSIDSLEEKYHRQVDDIQTKIDEYNDLVDKTNRSSVPDPVAVSNLSRRKLAIDAAKVLVATLETEIGRQEKTLDALFVWIDSDPLDQLRRMMADVAQDQDLEPIRRDFVMKNDYEPDGSIKTPSIVLSWNTKDLKSALTSIGGHNLNSRVLRFEASADVADMSLVQTEKGYTLRYNPSRASVIEANASELSRAIEHEKVTKTSDLAKIVDASPPRLARSRTAVLNLGENSQRDPWSGQIGMRVYEQKTQMVNDLGTLAEQNSCCVFVAHDSEGVAFATERNLKPPPGFIAVEIRDGVSLNSYLGNVAKRSGTAKERAVVFLDAPKSHVEAAVMNVTGGTTSEAELSRIANSLGTRSAKEVEARVDAVKVSDLKGRDSTLSLSERIRGSARVFFQRFSSPQTKLQWAQVEISSLDSATTTSLMKEIRWNPAVDGVPNGVVVKFGKTTASPIDVGVVAGFTESTPATAVVTIRGIADRTAAAASLKEASIAEFAATLRNDVQQLSALKIRRLQIVVKHGETSTLISLRWKVIGPEGFEAVEHG